MSNTVNCIYGYGFQATSVPGNTLEDFVQNHSETIKTVSEYVNGFLRYIERKPDAEDFREIMATYFCNDFYQGTFGIIAAVMSKETGITFEAYLDFETEEEYILFPDRIIWAVPEREKSLTAEDIKSICLKYMAELGIDGNPDYCRVEQWG